MRIVDANRLAGHTLLREGAPYTRAGKNSEWEQVYFSWTGQGVCSCGEYSDVLHSNNARKRWHRDHKDRLRETAGTAPKPEAVRLLEEAFFLRQNGEHAPGGNENWHDWERRTEVFLRSLLPPETRKDN